ncbi:hypothetical protein QTP88_018341 [Uroleucon formosanum]
MMIKYMGEHPLIEPNAILYTFFNTLDNNVSNGVIMEVIEYFVQFFRFLIIDWWSRYFYERQRRDFGIVARGQRPLLLTGRVNTLSSGILLSISFHRKHVETVMGLNVLGFLSPDLDDL